MIMMSGIPITQAGKKRITFQNMQDLAWADLVQFIALPNSLYNLL